MAKRKKQTRKKKKEPEVVERSTFWAITGGVLLYLIAIFMLLGGFGAGGPLPVSLFSGAYWALGWGSWLAIIGLAYFGTIKLFAPSNIIPLKYSVSTLAFVLSGATWFHTSFATLNEVGNYTGGNGGEAGALLGNIALNALDKWPASVMFLVFTVLLFFLASDISPKVLGKIFKALLPNKDQKEDTDLQNLKKSTGLVLNEGVPVERSTSSLSSRNTSLKNTGQKLSKEENHEALTTFADPDWNLPGVDLLIQKQDKADAGDIETNAEIIKETLANFNINVEVEGANVGPRVTQFTVKPPTGTKLNKITALENNLALDLAAQSSIRIEAPIPGKRAVGIEVPNKRSATVRIASILQSSEWNGAKSPLNFVIGKDISGNAVVGDLAKMPHLLVAGQTGSGKSVMINNILTSLLYRNGPSDLKLILVDPKQVELKPYDDIPHLLTPVITEPEKCISALKWTVAEMERRYKALSDDKKRNIVEYNKAKKEEGMPYIVVVIDELAELMMVAARDVEALVVRIAQKARAVGIHLVLATQRPSVDVITGLIKANVPARIAFTTVSQIDSRTIIDQTGSEKLLNKGDMLFKTSEVPKPRRIQAALIEDDETEKVTDFIRMQRPPQYDDEVVSQQVVLNGKGGVVADIGGTDENDDMYKDAVLAVIEGRKASTSLLQRRLRIGYGRAARIMETMEEQGIIGPADGNRPREVLVSSADEVFGGGNEGDVYDDMPDDEV
jgi:DNA segregation ATPase FtsK/SpoIIIE, S-DNA-T family